mgnify:CR=1 FL=1
MPQPVHILAIDQGTTSTRAIVFDRHARPVASAQCEFEQHYPDLGWVEHDPEDIWRDTLRLAKEAIEKSEVGTGGIAGIGLAAHLGAERVTLWGISYGTHLAMAALKAIPDEIDRAILASAEGLDQTVKLPSRTEAYIERLQAAVNAQPGAAAAYPDIAGMMARVRSPMHAATEAASMHQVDSSQSTSTGFAPASTTRTRPTTETFPSR